VVAPVELLSTQTQLAPFSMATTQKISLLELAAE
jgi:hypothetical protein